MKSSCRAWLTAAACMCLSLMFAERSGAWGIGSESKFTDMGLAHQWATQEGWKLFQYQFGNSEIDNYLGSVAEFPPGSASDHNSTVIEGAYDEDVVGQNPFGYDTADNHPSLRHFWSPRSTVGFLRSGDYSRNFDEGLGLLGSGAIGLSYDSAPNYAIKYFTGGIGFTGKTDSDWGSGGAQGAVQGKGIRDYYSGSGVEQDKSLAYYWFGHVLHLIEDIAVPAHSLGDPHLETDIPVLNVANDPDPVHDWVDGKTFSTTGVGGLPVAAFNDTDPHRYTNWGFQSGSGAVGRNGVPASMLSSPLRSSQQLISMYDSNGFAPETMNSVPNNFRQDVLPLYLLFSETARQSAKYDSKDKNGQNDQGNRADDSILDTNLYDNWTKSKIQEVADSVYPLAMQTAAESIRYFYSQVDDTPPTLSWIGLPNSEQGALQLSLQPQQMTLPLPVSLLASDDISGVNQDGFVYHVEQMTEGLWSDLGSALTSSNQVTLGAFGEGNYRVWAQVENGAGLSGVSPFGYFNVIPEPSTYALLALGITATLMMIRRRKS